MRSTSKTLWGAPIRKSLLVPQNVHELRKETMTISIDEKIIRMSSPLAPPSSPKTPISRHVQSLDEQIVSACNDLIRLKAQTAQKKVDNCNERALMKRDAERKEIVLAKRLRQVRTSKEISTYRDVCDQVFGQHGVKLPAIVTSRQAQLCQSVHLITVTDTQTDLMRRHKRTELLKLEEDLNKLQQERCINEHSLLRDILELEQQIQEIECSLEACPPVTEKADHTVFSKRKNTSESDRTLDTISLEEDARESDKDFIPATVQSPLMTAPRRPVSLSLKAPFL